MHTETPKLQPSAPGYRLRIPSDEQLENLTSGTLRINYIREILAEIGIHCPLDQALHIYAEHGARIDFEDQIIVTRR